MRLIEHHQFCVIASNTENTVSGKEKTLQCELYARIALRSR